ncbi:MAG: dephospho-CoA kinase [Betaproteobacteria bacterium]|nr:dephospho-CoA kinase [Betaproteobacteria bacterium]
MPFVVGLTGGIGSGKSTVAKHFMDRGARVVDTDAIAHELTAPGGAAIEAIRREFGAWAIAPDGALDRPAMRRHVFARLEARRTLEAILHPLIRAEAQRLCAASRAPYVVLVVPLLVESGDYAQRCNRVLVVDCDEQTQVARVVARSGMSPAQVRAIMATQASREQRLAAAHDVVDNSGDPGRLEGVVDRLHRQYVEMAGQTV